MTIPLADMVDPKFLKENIQSLSENQLHIRSQLNIPENKALIIPYLYELHLYSEVIAYGELIAEGDLTVY